MRFFLNKLLFVRVTFFDIIRLKCHCQHIPRKLHCLRIPRFAYLLLSFGLPNVKDDCRNFLSLIIKTRNFFPAGRLSLHLHKHVFHKHLLECGTMTGYLLYLKSNPFFFRDKSKSRERSPASCAVCTIHLTV
jgi:hypothetical protein